MQDKPRRCGSLSASRRASDTCAESSDILRSTILKLAHLDLTDSVQYDAAVMKAHGGYCDVFVGSARTSDADGQCHIIKVAIKRLRVHISSDRDFAKLLAKELHVWSRLHHPNILPLLGYVLEGDYPSIISEWVENGTVARYIKENPDVDILPLIIGIANGVDYLHGKDIVHSDLKADNVLVGKCGEALICDFGVSRMLQSSLSLPGTSTGGLKGSVRWMALELLDLTAKIHHTKETDIWALGMTIYEILTRNIPFKHLKIDPFVMFAIMQGNLPSRPSSFDAWPEALQAVWVICEDCWISPPEDRITIGQIISYLDAINASRSTARALATIQRQSSSGETSNLYEMVDSELESLNPCKEASPTSSGWPVLHMSLPLQSTSSPSSSYYYISSPTQTSDLSLHQIREIRHIEQQESSTDVLHSVGSTQGSQDCSFLVHRLFVFNPEASRESHLIPTFLWDVRYPPESARLFFPSGQPILLPDVSQFLTSPPQPVCFIAVGLFPSHDLTVDVCNKHGVTIGDVLSALYQKLHQPVRRAGWSGISRSSSKHEARIIEAFQRRIRLTGDSILEEHDCIRKVDLLLRNTVFVGLKPIDWTSCTWLLVTKSSDD